MRQGMVTQIRFPVLPVVEGCLKIYVTAKTILYTDREVIEICVQVNIKPLIFRIKKLFLCILLYSKGNICLILMYC